MAESAAADAEEAIGAGVSLILRYGGKFLFKISTDNVNVVNTLCNTALKLGALYAGYNLLRPIVDGAVKKALGGERDDQGDPDIKPGSLHVRLHCFTDERFLEVLADYESGKISKRLQEEFLRVEIKVNELKVEIENMEEVNETKKAIIRRNLNQGQEIAEGPADKDDDLNAYDKHWFIKKEIALEYRCDACSNILKDAMQITTCGHQFCRLCLPREVKTCPACNRDVQSQNEVFPDEAVRKKILSLEMRCPVKSCRWKGTLQDFIQPHKNECPSKPVKCKNKECEELVSESELENHLKACEHTEMACQHCEEMITKANEKDHYTNACVRFPVQCPQNCTMEIPKGELQDHIEDECEKTLIECTFRTVGCNDEVERGKLQEHEEQKANDHLSQAVQIIVKLEEEKQEMTEEIKQLRDALDGLQKELRDFNEKREERVKKIDLELEEFKEKGTLRLDGVQQAVEQNFEGLASVVQTNEEFKRMLVETQEQLHIFNKNETIPEIQNTCHLNQGGNKELAENQDRMHKITIIFHNKLKNELAIVRNEMNTKVDALSQEQEAERTVREQHEAECKEEISRLNEAIAENRTRINNTEMALTTTQDEMRNEFSNHCKQMKLDYDNLSCLIKKEKESRENAMVQVSEKMSGIRPGMVIWRVSNVESNINEASSVQSKAKPLLGEAFYSEPYGYLLQPKIFFNGARLNDQAYISVFIQIVKGPFDPVLKWPFEKRIRITLIEQESRGLRRNIQKVLIPAADGKEAQRPCHDTNNGFGIYKFVSHEVLRAGRYITDDVFFVKLKVLEDHDGHNETL